MSRADLRSVGPDRRPWLDRIPGSLSALEFLLLGLAAAFLVMLVIPYGFGIESSCVGALGVQRTVGDTFVAGFAALGSFGWLAVFLGTIYAGIAGRRDIVLLLPLLWFLVLVVGALTVAVFVGPAPCPS